MTVVADAGPVIALVQIRRLDLLRHPYGSIVIPTDVAQGVARTLPDPPDWFVIRPVGAKALALVGQPPLDTGEHAAIALALTLRVDWVILDDRRARRRADRLGLPVIGMIGVLLAAKQHDLIPAIRPLLDDLRAARLYISERLFALALAAAHEGDESP